MTNVLDLSSLPESIAAEAVSSRNRQSEMHGITVTGYYLSRSWLSGTPRVLVYLAGVDRSGFDLGLANSYPVTEIYDNERSVSKSEFARLWNMTV